MRPHSDRLRIFASAYLRASATGLAGVLLGLYLAAQGKGPGAIGLTIGLGLAGNAVGTLAAGVLADRLGRRGFLVIISILFAIGGVGLALGLRGAWLAAAIFFGMVNGMGRDRGAASTLDQVMLPATGDDRVRTSLLSWYHLTVDLGHATGSLAAALPVAFRAAFHCDTMTSYRWSFGAYVAVATVVALLYAGLSPAVEVARAATPKSPVPADPAVRSIIRRFAALSGIDSLGGGFLTTALIAYYFYRRFGVDEAVLAPFFFAARLLNAASYLLAARLARRIGLVNTMVFTHLPSSLILLLVPFAPSLGLAMALFLVRELLVEMDVPTRQSYLLAVVPPEHRTFGASLAALARNTAYAISPGIAGWAMGSLGLSAALVAGSTLKVGYDLVLYKLFRGIRPPEEHRTGAAGAEPAETPAG
jgi:MFS family permease